MLIAATAIAACSSGSATTSSAPTPASAQSGATTTAKATSGGLPAGVTTAMIAEGDSLFHAASCVRCHGADAKGAQNGPSLMGPTFMHVNGTYEDFVRLIMSGVPADSIKDKTHRFAMRPKGGGQTPLTDDQVKAVAAYVYSLSHK
ncbi:MAG TPA: c-type cytochrome [Gemmatimonadaceae bacterium]|nr:c-type cytochrome [Gemmatimonadaceae bacterium]